MRQGEDLKQRRSCGNCKAHEDNSCSLGYQNEERRGKEGKYIDTVPLEPCPKPLSTKRLFELLISKPIQSVHNSNQPL